MAIGDVEDDLHRPKIGWVERQGGALFATVHHPDDALRERLIPVRRADLCGQLVAGVCAGCGCA